MGSAWIAGAFALFVWWFSTGAILVAVRRADRHGRRAHKMLTLAALPVLGAGIAGIYLTRGMDDVAGVYLAFLSALAIWGWIELAFLTGLITGPNPAPCPEDTPEWERFIRAWGTLAYSEMLLAASLIWIMVLCWQADNTFGMWTFLILFFARISAKLNLFFGVPNINVEFLPKPLAHLPSHFRRARMNWVFPVSITALCFALGCFLERLISAPDATTGVGFALLAALTGLAMVEHWVMVLPIPDAKLWRWLLPDQDPNDPTKTAYLTEDAHGLR